MELTKRSQNNSTYEQNKYGYSTEESLSYFMHPAQYCFEEKEDKKDDLKRYFIPIRRNL